MRIDLNADIGEGCGDDLALLACVSSASIACGGHAGDAASMRLALQRCRAAGVAAGAHPSHADRAHFGRRALPMAPAQAHALVRAQLQQLQTLADAEGVPLRHVKPHGALYNQAADDAELAEAIAGAVRDHNPGLLVFGLAGSALPAAARRLGLRAVDEAFADRAYDARGRLLPRTAPGSVRHAVEPVVAQAVAVALQGQVMTPEGPWPLTAHSLCLHGDTPGAVALGQAVAAALRAAGVQVAAPNADPTRGGA